MARPISFELTGQKEIKKALAKALKLYPRATAAALYQEGFSIQAQATKLAPVKFGVLRSSAYTAPPRDPKAPVVEVGFGTKYALRQHEGVNYAHPRGGQAKYLQKACELAVPGFAERIARRVKALAAAGKGSDALPALGATKPKPDKGLAKRGLRSERKARMTKAREVRSARREKGRELKKTKRASKRDRARAKRTRTTERKRAQRTARAERKKARRTATRERRRAKNQERKAARKERKAARVQARREKVKARKAELRERKKGRTTARREKAKAATKAKRERKATRAKAKRAKAKEAKAAKRAAGVKRRAAQKARAKAKPRKKKRTPKRKR